MTLLSTSSAASFSDSEKHETEGVLVQKIIKNSKKVEREIKHGPFWVQSPVQVCMSQFSLAVPGCPIYLLYLLTYYVFYH